MGKTVKLTLILITIGVLILTSIWYYKTSDLEPLIGIFTAASGLIILIFTKPDQKKNKDDFKQKQKTGDNSTAYQARRDININK